MPTSLEIKIALLRAGVTQDDIAAKFKITKSGVSHILAGRRKPPKRFHETVARMVKRPRRELFPDGEPSAP